MVMSDEEKKVTAYHEGGHALIAALEEHTDPLHKVTIIPRGRALGVTQQLPLEDKYTYSKEYIEAELAVMMGGRLAEEACIGRVTTGASNDFEKATQMARRMVCEWGMSEMGPMSFGRGEGEIFLAATSRASPTTGGHAKNRRGEQDRRAPISRKRITRYRAAREIANSFSRGVDGRRGDLRRHREDDGEGAPRRSSEARPGSDGSRHSGRQAREGPPGLASFPSGLTDSLSPCLYSIPYGPPAVPTGTHPRNPTPPPGNTEKGA
jgi:hypothetical protein